MSKPVAQRKISVSRCYKNVFESPDGRRVLVSLMARAGMLAAEPDEPNRVSYNNGRRSVVLEILQELRFDEERLLELSQATEEAPLDLVFN